MNEQLFRRSGALLFADQTDVLRSMSRGFHGKDAELDLGTMLSCLLVAAAFFIAIGLVGCAAPMGSTGRSAGCCCGWRDRAICHSRPGCSCSPNASPPRRSAPKCKGKTKPCNRCARRSSADCRRKPRFRRSN